MFSHYLAEAGIGSYHGRCPGTPGTQVMHVHGHERAACFHVLSLPALATLANLGRGTRPGEHRQAARLVTFPPRPRDVVRTVHRGGRYVDPELAADAISAGDSPLTPREADVLELAAGGAPVDEIAKRAALTPGTVRNYLSSAAAKLGAANRHEAVQLARSRGWI